MGTSILSGLTDGMNALAENLKIIFDLKAKAIKDEVDVINGTSIKLLEEAGIYMRKLNSAMAKLNKTQYISNQYGN